MSANRLVPLRASWVLAGLGATALLAASTALVGLVLLPLAQPGLGLDGVWEAICSAAGVPRAATPAAPVPGSFTTSSVVVPSAILAHPAALSIGRGATLALQCAICHGTSGVSQANSPNLAGQYADVIYKQLVDFKTGARVNAVMTPFAASLREQDMLDLAAFYAYLPKLQQSHSDEETSATRIVTSGAPMRGIAPCGSCHGSIDRKAGSPWLYGQSAVYIKAQLQAFASGLRHNDINQQMRNVGRQMTSEDIDHAAQYYEAGQ